MKTLIFFGLRNGNNYAFDAFSDLYNYRKILIIGKQSIKDIADEFYKTMDQIYLIETTKHRGLIYEFDFDQAAEIIEQEKSTSTNVILFCTDEGLVLQAAKLREKFNIPGPRPEVIDLFRNKIKMKQVLKAAGIRVPVFTELDKGKLVSQAELYYKELVAVLGDKFIVKPIDSAGSYGAMKIASYNDFSNISSEIKNEFLYEAEEFIEGTMYYCDTVAAGKEICFSESSQYSTSTLDFQAGVPLGVLPLPEDNKINQEIKEFTKSVINALGIPDGIHHTEVIISNNNEIVFIESGARASGLLSVLAYEKTYGINILNLEVSLLSGANIKKQTSASLHTFNIYFPSKKGKLKKNQMPKLNGKYNLHWYYNDAEKIKASSSNVDMVAYVTVWNNNFEEAKNDLSTLTQYELASFH